MLDFPIVFACCSSVSDSNNKEELLITVIGTSDESNKISKNRIKYNAGIPISSETDTELSSTVKANGGQFRSNSELIVSSDSY